MDFSSVKGKVAIVTGASRGIGRAIATVFGEHGMNVVCAARSQEQGQAVASVRNTSAAELRPGTDYTARFVRGDESRTDGGSGLGLSIADSFTKACGGTLSITTEADLFPAAVVFPVAP